MRKNKLIIPLVWILLLALIGVILFLSLSKEDTEPINLWKIRVEGMITFSSFHRGFIEVERNIWISTNLPEVTKYEGAKTGRSIDAITAPYRLQKQARDSVLQLVKNRDTLFFKILRQDSINDPTFSQLFR